MQSDDAASPPIEQTAVACAQIAADMSRLAVLLLCVALTLVCAELPGQESAESVEGIEGVEGVGDGSFAELKQVRGGARACDSESSFMKRAPIQWTLCTAVHSGQNLQPLYREGHCIER